ncbi:MAG: tripartite tricarboxylate transporter TctB family protein [Planctomycetota bacterium]|nr:tripartite tricarboxylate transporter TctB family protein [Planctomycetota bacterium]
MRHKSDLVSTGAFMAAAILFIAGALRLGVGSATSDGVPGAGFFPFILGLIILVLGAVQATLFFRDRGEKKASFALPPDRRANVARIAATVGGMLGLFVLWKLVCFEAAAPAFCLFLNRVYGRGWLFNVVFSVLMTLLIHLLFTRLLYIQFN